MVGDIRIAIVGFSGSYSPAFLEMALGSGGMFYPLFVFIDVFKFVSVEGG